MQYNKMAMIAMLMAATMVSGCASVARGTKEKFTITSMPEGAKAELVGFDTKMECTTPCKLKVKRKSQFTVKFTKDGYEPTEVAVRGKLKGGGGSVGVLGNVLLGGVIGAVVDGSNGAMMDLTPNPVAVTMKQVALVTPAAAPDAPVAATPTPADAGAAPAPIASVAAAPAVVAAN